MKQKLGLCLIDRWEVSTSNVVEGHTDTWNSGMGVIQFPDAGECGAVAVQNAVGLHVLVLGKVIERVYAALRETLVVRSALRHLSTINHTVGIELQVTRCWD